MKQLRRRLLPAGRLPVAKPPGTRLFLVALDSPEAEQRLNDLIKNHGRAVALEDLTPNPGPPKKNSPGQSGVTGAEKRLLLGQD